MKLDDAATVMENSTMRLWATVCGLFKDTWFFLNKEPSVSIFCLACFSRLAVLLWTGSLTEIEPTEAINVARSLFRNETFSDPYGLVNTGPTAHLAPMYPLLLSLILRLLGDGPVYSITVRTLAVAAASAQYALLPVLARKLGINLSVAVAAGLIGAALPFRLWLETAGGHENVFSGLALLLLFLISVPLCAEGCRSPKRAALRGFAWGVGLLLSPLLFMALLAILIVVVVANRKLVGTCLIIALVAVLVVLPWVVRNYYVFNAFVPVRSSIGLELAVSNNDQSTGVENWNMRSWRHPFTHREEAVRMRQMGEIPYYALRKDEAVAWITGSPRRFLKLTLLRVAYFWFTPVYGFEKGVLLAMFTILGFLGIALLSKDKPVHAAVLGSICFFFPLPYYFLQVSPRYRYPIDWVFWMMSIYAIATLLSKRWKISR